MLKALTAKYEGEIAIATANIEVYLNNPVGIGEHSNIVQEVDKLIGIIAENEEKIRVIDETSFLTKKDNNFNFNFDNFIFIFKHFFNILRIITIIDL